MWLGGFFFLGWGCFCTGGCEERAGGFDAALFPARRGGGGSGVCCCCEACVGVILWRRVIFRLKFCVNYSIRSLPLTLALL